MKVMDYKELLNNIEIEKLKTFMEELEIPLIKETNEYLLYPTACHNKDIHSASHKLYFYKDKKFFMCYTECGGINLFKFLEHYYEAHGIEYDWFGDILYKVYSLSGKLFLSAHSSLTSYDSMKDRYLLPQGQYAFKTYDDSILQMFTKWYPPEWLEDNIAREAMDKFEILFSISHNRIIIPHRDSTGKLIGIRARLLDPWLVENVGKYLPMEIEGVWYAHPLGLNLYGLDKNARNIRETGVAFLFEGEKSVLQAESFDFPNCGVAVCGSRLHKYQLRSLLKEARPREIVICFDKEEKPGQSDYFYKLYEMGKKYNKLCNFSFIYDKNNLLEMQDSPTDKGEEVFMQLLSERVRIK